MYLLKEVAQIMRFFLPGCTSQVCLRFPDAGPVQVCLIS